MKHLNIKIHGIVQGVGFRPFIHKLMRQYSLAGYISNTSSGVELELEGEQAELERFVSDIPMKAPKLAVIEKTELEYSDNLVGFKDFEIRISKTEAVRNTLISPDICICDDCLKELFSPSDRRFRYPFINCTNCGPRFTIIKDVPYDRAKTSMSSFPMCPSCSREYHDIEDRRYHAQPDACPECGPQAFFLDENGTRVNGDAVEIARQYIKEDKIIAVKGLGGIHLACTADKPDVAARLRQRKHRDEKPFAVMCRNVESVRKLCELSIDEEKVLTGFRRPIVLLKKKASDYSHISENGYIGVMLPYTPLHYLLFGDDIDMLVMTSANLSDTPIMYQNDEAVQCLQGIADGFLLHNRDIQTRCDDSLCWVIDGREYFARRSRGYVPFPITVHAENKTPVLACGAEQKASFCLSKDDYAFPSQHIGDLKNIETLDNYSNQIAHFENLFDIKPKLIACDLHPDYLSTEYAQQISDQTGSTLIRVQHHHAHMASCMADNGLNTPVIGLVWDGTGLGTDGTIWGGECLAGDYSAFKRLGTILPIRLPGGDLCTKDISRTAFSLLYQSGCDTSAFANAKALKDMVDRNFNAPLSSGMGRLFDGIACILGIKKSCSYEGQGAVLLEASAADDVDKTAPVDFIYNDNILVFDWRSVVKYIVEKMAEGLSPSVLSAVFMNTLIEMAVQTCDYARRNTGYNDVCLSGGSFQNMYIMSRLPAALKAGGFNVYHHVRVSTNDEGIALGQLMVARTVAEYK